jgi:GNAT superfamily N-acetyltransferase
MPEPTLTVRPASEADVPLILRFIRGLAEYERLLEACVATEAALREHLFGPRRYCEVLIADLDDEPVGFALYFFNYSTFLAKPGLYLEDIFVLPERRRVGVGQALLRRLAQIAVERGCGRLEWSVLDWNEPAISFYRRLGARLLDEWTTCRLEGPALAAVAAGGDPGPG